MVNSKKKMNKSTVAIVVLALLLVLSLVLTATGAWFTDKDSKDQNSELTFGKVSIALTGADTGTWSTSTLGKQDKVMPGSTYTGTLTLANNGDQDIWVRTTENTVATLTIGGKTITGVDGITVKFEMDKDSTNHDATEHGTAEGVYGLAVGKKQDFKVTVTIDGAKVGNVISTADGDVTLNDGTNDVTGLLTVKLEVEAVQQTNNADATFPDTVTKAEINS